MVENKPPAMLVYLKARAVGRMGELFNQIEPQSRSGRNQHSQGGPPPPGREQAAREAGVSQDQRKQAQRVANIPAMEPLEREKARQAVAGPSEGKGKKSGSGNFPEAVKGRARDKIGAFSGLSGKTVEKIAAVCEAAEEDPEEYEAQRLLFKTKEQAAKYIKVASRQEELKAKSALHLPVDQLYALCSDNPETRAKVLTGQTFIFAPYGSY